jgi:hypothetical protein
MTFGKGDHLPCRKQAAPPKARGRRTKELRKLAKQACAQVQRMKKHLPTLCRQEIMKSVMRMSARRKKGMMSRENECDLIV